MNILGLPVVCQDYEFLGDICVAIEALCDEDHSMNILKFKQLGLVQKLYDIIQQITTMSTSASCDIISNSSSSSSNSSDINTSSSNSINGSSGKDEIIIRLKKISSQLNSKKKY